MKRPYVLWNGSPIEIRRAARPRRGWPRRAPSSGGARCGRQRRPSSRRHQVIETSETVGPKEALVPHVVEVLDHPVAPRFSQGDEAGNDVEVQAGGHHRPEHRPRRRDRPSEVRVVVELSDGRDAERSPHVGDPGRHPGGTRGTQDRAARRMGVDVDQVSGHGTRWPRRGDGGPPCRSGAPLRARDRPGSGRAPLWRRSRPGGVVAGRGPPH
jgi:hypothetical protein